MIDNDSCTCEILSDMYANKGLLLLEEAFTILPDIQCCQMLPRDLQGCLASEMRILIRCCTWTVSVRVASGGLQQAEGVGPARVSGPVTP